MEFFDDSKGTNVGPRWPHLRGWAQNASWSSSVATARGQDFSPWPNPVARYARAVVLIGRDAPAFALRWTDTGVGLEDASSMPGPLHAPTSVPMQATRC